MPLHAIPKMDKLTLTYLITSQQETNLDNDYQVNCLTP